MASTEQINPANLLFDLENPRLPSRDRIGQRETMRELARLQNNHLVALAEDIVSFGLSPAELMIVVPSTSETERFTVLDGNRRLTAIRALESPDAFNGAVTSFVLGRLHDLSASYQRKPISAVSCVIMNDPKEAEHWVFLRHTGRNSGEGIVEWSSHEKARYRAHAGGEVEIHTRLLQFLEEGGHLTREEIERVPATNFRRLMETIAVREKLGIQVIRGGGLHFRDEPATIRGLLYIINDLTSKQTKVQDIYTKEQRAQYAERMPAGVVPAPVRPSPAQRSGRQAPPPVVVTAATKRVALSRLKKQRDRLIPSECFLKIPDARIRKMSVELRGLDLADYTNAISVLFRVFLELSVDYYLTVVMKLPDNAIWQKLSKKLTDVAADLETKKQLSRHAANAVRAASQKNSFLVPSIIVLHDYIHSRHMFPSPADLRAEWDGLQPFFVAIWPR